MNIEDKYPETTEFMDKCLFQGSDVSMEDAIRQYCENGPEVVRKVLMELDELLQMNEGEDVLLEYIERHSDYIVNDSAFETFSTMREVLAEGCVP